MSYRIVGIDVHKKMLAVVVSDAWKLTASTSLSGGCLAATPTTGTEREIAQQRVLMEG